MLVLIPSVMPLRMNRIGFSSFMVSQCGGRIYLTRRSKRFNGVPLVWLGGDLIVGRCAYNF